MEKSSPSIYRDIHGLVDNGTSLDIPGVPGGKISCKICTLDVQILRLP